RADPVESCAGSIAVPRRQKGRLTARPPLELGGIRGYLRTLSLRPMTDICANRSRPALVALVRYADVGCRPRATQACSVSGDWSAPLGHTIVPNSSSTLTCRK